MNHSSKIYILKTKNNFEILNYVPMIDNLNTICYRELEIYITNKRVYNGNVIYEYEHYIRTQGDDILPFLKINELFDVFKQKIIKPRRNTSEYNNFPYKIEENIDQIYKKLIEITL